MMRSFIIWKMSLSHFIGGGNDPERGRKIHLLLIYPDGIDEGEVCVRVLLKEFRGRFQRE